MTWKILCLIVNNYRVISLFGCSTPLIGSLHDKDTFIVISLTILRLMVQQWGKVISARVISALDDCITKYGKSDLFFMLKKGIIDNNRQLIMFRIYIFS